MLQGVYMLKFDMLNPNLTSKITTKNSTRAKHVGQTFAFKHFKPTKQKMKEKE